MNKNIPSKRSRTMYKTSSILADDNQSKGLRNFAHLLRGELKRIEELHNHSTLSQYEKTDRAVKLVAEINKNIDTNLGGHLAEIEDTLITAAGELFSNNISLTPSQIVMLPAALDKFKDHSKIDYSNTETAGMVVELSKLGFVSSDVLSAANRVITPDAVAVVESSSDDMQSLSKMRTEFDTARSEVFGDTALANHKSI